MQAYADYTFYTDTYHGEMEEVDFERHALSASQYIRAMTYNRSDGYAGDELKYAVCESSDILHELSEKTRSNSGGEKKSENTDGYSVAYVVEGKDGETALELAGRKIGDVIRKWLLPTGLLYARARCGHVDKCRNHNL